MNFNKIPTKHPEVFLIESKKFVDERGFFLESYQKKAFLELGISEDFSQDNLSVSKQNVLRGLHFQLPPFSQSKLVRVIKGEIWDVAVDIRKSSKTYKQWVGVTLNDHSGQALYIPEGFAHGFLVLSDEATVLYKASNSYSKESERGIIWNSQDLNIDWPIKQPILSPKDAAYGELNTEEIFN